MRVLVVDDVAAVADFLARRLRAQGFTALWATSMGEVEKMLAAEDFEFDAIVADFDLGRNEPSGVDLLKFAHEKFPSARRILVSGSDLEGDPPVVAETFLRKPIRDADLVKALCAPPKLVRSSHFLDFNTPPRVGSRGARLGFISASRCCRLRTADGGLRLDVPG